MYNVSPSTQGLIFDFDGTIVDSMPAHFLSWQEAFSAFGETFLEPFFYAHAGVSLIGVVEAYNRENSTALSPTAVVKSKEQAFRRHTDRIVPIPQVLDVMNQYRGRLPMAVATGNTRLHTLPLMERLGLRDYFDALVFGDDVSKPKPSPECFLKAANLIGVSPEHCVVFEDGVPGLEGARRAGMTAVDIRPWVTTDSTETAFEP